MLSAGGLDSALIANMGEDIVVAHHNECEFAKVRVRGEILQGVQLEYILNERYAPYEIVKYELLVQEVGKPRRCQSCCSLHDLVGQCGYNVRACGGRELSTYPRNRSLIERWVKTHREY